MAGATKPQTLNHTGLETIKLFKQIKAIDNFAGTAGHEEWPKAEFAAEADRFELWAVNLGLFVSGHGSLDYRVRQAESIGYTLRRFLTGLNNALAEAIEYAIGKSDPSPTDVRDDPAGNNVDLDSLDEDFGDGASQEIESDMELLLDSIKDPIDRLYKLSTWIRNPSSRFWSSKALRHREIDPDSGVDLLQAFEEFDYDYISSLFLQYQKSKALQEYPTVNPSENKDRGGGDDSAENVWEPIRTVLSQYKVKLCKTTESFLVRRIALANVHRRMQFAYWKKHRDKLVQHADAITKHIEVHNERSPIKLNEDKPANEAAIPAIAAAQSVTTATRLNISQLAVRDDQSNVSVSEYAPSTWQPNKEVPDFPPAPKRPPSEKFFECPYCFTLCSNALLAENAWKAHLIHDLRPYICTYEDCRNPDQLYDTRKDWVQHENSSHRRILRCPEHPDQTFSTLEGYQEHLRDAHVDCSDEISATLTIHASESTFTSPDRCCPICSLSLATVRALQSHIALHLERFSLFSLTRLIDKDENDANEAGSDKAHVAFDGSRDEDFSEDFDLMWEDDLGIENRDIGLGQGLPRLTHGDYTVALICQMGIEFAPLMAMLDKNHQSLRTSRDQNSYTLGSMAGHNVVIAAMPETGKAATVVIRLLNDFLSIRFGLLVGIGGGIPSGTVDIRLGDVVVSKPTGNFGGVIQFDRGKTLSDRKIMRTGSLAKPPSVLSTYMAQLSGIQEAHGNQIKTFLSKLNPRMKKRGYTYQGSQLDLLFQANYTHPDEETCEKCDYTKLIPRHPRDNDIPEIHYGTIGSSNLVIKDGEFRDKLRKELGIICVDMEAAGLMDDFPCLVIRGICDYADTHKNDRWQRYAAATAAAYAKELLSIIPSA